MAELKAERYSEMTMDRTNKPAEQAPPEPVIRSVWVVEDHHVMRRNLAEIIDGEPGMSCPHALPSVEDLVAALGEGEPPDLILMDIGLPGLSGIEGVRRVASLSPATRVLILTIHGEDEKVFEAICAGACGYLLKPSSPETIVRAIHDVGRGAAPINPYIARKMLGFFSRLGPLRPAEDDYGLSRREKEILQLLVDGLTLKSIAGELHLSYHTVSNHLRNVYAKLHVRSRSGAIAKALREKLL